MTYSTMKPLPKGWIPAAILLVLVIAAICLIAGAYVVEEGRLAVVTQFGKPVRFVSDAGLKFKVPFVQEVSLLEKRLLPWDGAPESMQTRDKKRIFIDVWGRWKITDLETFYRAVRSEQRGQKILDDLVDSAVRNVVARNNLIDVVRSTNDPLTYENEELARSAEASRDEVTTGRAAMETDILSEVQKAMMADDGEKSRYGMELSVVHVKRVNYVESVKETVHGRMRSERQRVAKLFESEAIEEQNRILGLTRLELDKIEGEMERESARIRGDADAKVIQMTAEAYGQSPEALEFYRFLRRLEVFRNSLDRNSRVILSTESDVFRLFEDAGTEP